MYKYESSLDMSESKLESLLNNKPCAVATHSEFINLRRAAAFREKYRES